MVEQIEFPPHIAELGLLGHVTYADAFMVTTTDDRTAEQWMRPVMMGAPTALRAGVRAAHRLLGLRLSDHSDQKPLGWNVLRTEPTLFVMGADGPTDAARLTASIQGRELTFTTQAHFSPRTRLLWVGLQHVHRATARHLLDKAVQVGAGQRDRRSR